MSGKISLYRHNWRASIENSICYVNGKSHHIIHQKEKEESSRKAAKSAKGKKDFYLSISFLCFLSDLRGFA